MAVLTSSRMLPAAARTVAAVVFDWSKDPAWRPKVRRMEVDPPGAAQPGQRIVEHLRFAGLPFVTPTRITEVGAEQVWYAGGSAAVVVEGSRRVDPIDGERCRVTVVVDVRLAGLLRPLTGLLAPSYRRLQEGDLDRLAQLVESGRITAPPA